MSLQIVTPRDAFEQYVEDKVDEFTEFLTRQLCYMGEAALKAARDKTHTVARDKRNYKDDSGNLRNSTGYVIAVDGQITARAGFDTKHKDGADFAEQLARTTEGKAVLVVCAGMSYATYVSARGYDVLDSAELEAQRMANELTK